MSNSKISALTSAATVVGTEVLPIVQTSATVKVAISDLNPGLSTILATKGGTGQTSYAVGDILYASTTTALSKLADVATGNALISGGISTAPSWGKIGMTTHVSGVLPIANGGTNASTSSITSFNNITGYTASGATGTTSTNLVFSTSPSVTTPTWLGNATLSTGNIIQGTAAKGFDFSANTPQAGKTSTILNWYEEGTFTPTLSGATTTTYTTQKGYYTRVGRQIFFQCELQINSVGDGSTTIAVLGTLPTAGAFSTISVGFFTNIATAVTSLGGYIGAAGGNTVQFRSSVAAAVNNTANAVFQNNARVIFSGQYFV
jgi:hypothetical protein